MPSAAVTADEATLRRMLEDLVGKPFLFARPTYAEELTIHFGEERADPLPRFPDHVSGALVVRTRDSGWTWRDAGGLLVAGVQPGDRLATEDFARVAARVPTRRGSVVVRALAPVTTFGGSESSPVEILAVTRSLLVGFDDGTRLCVYPDLAAPPPEDDDLADWEVWIPEGCLLVGPGEKVAWEERIQGASPAG